MQRSGSTWPTSKTRSPTRNVNRTSDEWPFGSAERIRGTPEQLLKTARAYASQRCSVIVDTNPLDFGKAYVDRPSPYTPDQIAESIDDSRQLFDVGDWPAIEDAVLDLKLIGIVYLDIKPAYIRPI